MRDVSIIGIGQTKVGEHWETSLRHLAFNAMDAALRDAGVQRVDGVYIGNMLGGQLSGQIHLGPLLADFAGLRGVEAVRVEAAGASGGAALRQAYLAVASGLMDFALVVGVEKMTDRTGSVVVSAQATALDSEYEAPQGLTPVAAAALIMRRYMAEYGYELRDFAGFSVNAHANAASNPNAMYRNKLSPDSFVKAPMVADPINLFDMAPAADGAAAVVLCPTDIARQCSSQPVRIAGSSLATDTLSLHDRRDLLMLDAVNLSAGRAYEQAGIGPGDIDVFEAHDGYTIHNELPYNLNHLPSILSTATPHHARLPLLLQSGPWKGVRQAPQAGSVPGERYLHPEHVLSERRGGAHKPKHLLIEKLIKAHTIAPAGLPNPAAGFGNPAGALVRLLIIRSISI